MDEKLAYGISRQSLRRIEQSWTQVSHLIEKPFRPLARRAGEGRLTRAKDFNRAAKVVQASCENHPAYVSSYCIPMRLSQLSRSKDVNGRFYLCNLEVDRMHSQADNSEPDSGMAYLLSHTQVDAERNDVQFFNYQQPAIFYQHALKRYYQRSGLTDKTVEPADEIIPTALWLSMLFFLSGHYIDKKYFNYDIAVPWVSDDKEFRGAFFGQCVQLPKTLDTGYISELGKRRLKNHDLLWRHGMGAAIHTFCGRNFLTHDQEAALRAFADWLDEERPHFDPRIPFAMGLPLRELSDVQRAVLEDFISFIEAHDFDLLFTHGERTRRGGGLKTLDFVNTAPAS